MAIGRKSIATLLAIGVICRENATSTLVKWLTCVTSDTMYVQPGLSTKYGHDFHHPETPASWRFFNPPPFHGPESLHITTKLTSLQFTAYILQCHCGSAVRCLQHGVSWHFYGGSLIFISSSSVGYWVIRGLQAHIFGCACPKHKCPITNIIWLALAEQKCFTKPLINKTFNPGLPGGPYCSWQAIIQINIEAR